MVKQEPDNYLAHTFLGMCYLFTKGKQAKGEKMIKDTIEKTTDPTVKNLGNVALHWAEKDLPKKMNTPFFAQQKESPEED